MSDSCDILILGGGLAGLAAASVLGDRAIVLEKEDRPGGLVRSHSYDGYWFDRVLHLLYFDDPQTESRLRRLPGTHLAECKPVAWVETACGTTRFPIQMHLGHLRLEAAIECVNGLAEASIRAREREPAQYEDMLLRTFGSGLCRIFMHPYNRKVWKRPLDSLAPVGFQWNITRPEFENVLRGAIDPDAPFDAYNSRGFYPRPGNGHPVRGMEVISRALAARVKDIRLGHRITAIDPETRTVSVVQGTRSASFTYEAACVSTIPLPETITICTGVPDALVEDCRKLVRNRVVSVAVSVRGPRPETSGHWRYYADESLIFTRLIFMHAFDADLAPPAGWGLLAEIVEPAEDPLLDERAVLDRTREDIIRAGALPPGCEIIDMHRIIADPAYVVFTGENREIISKLRDHLEQSGIIPLGRFGRWEYSSMGQVMRDGFICGETLLGAATGEAPVNGSRAGKAGSERR